MALQLCCNLMELQPRNHEVLAMAGIVCRSIGELSQSIAYLSAAINHGPSSFIYYNNLGLSYQDQKNSLVARLCFEKALQLAPNDGDALNNLGVLALEEGATEEAESLFRRALDVERDHKQAILNLAGVLFKQKKYKVALQTYESVIAAGIEIGRGLLGKANCLGSMGNYLEALKFAEQALKTDNSLKQQVLHTKGLLHETVGDIEDACAAYEECLKISLSVEALYSRSRLKKVEKNSWLHEQIDISAGLNERLRGEEKAKLCYAQAKAAEDLGEIGNAAEKYKEGAAEVLKGGTFNEAYEDNFTQRIVTYINSEYLESNRDDGYPSMQPVFIVGMPRSGTTLVEQILASHSKVTACGELLHMNSVLDGYETPGLKMQMGRVPIYPGKTLRERGEIYLRKVKEEFSEGLKERFTDKLPANYRILGLIETMLPSSTIIHCRRSPVDTCLSCYKQLFYDGQLWSYDLAVLGRQYRRYWQLMNHWRKIMANRIIEVRYEGIVDNLESEARRLIDWTGLEWDWACTRYWEKRRPVTTASVAQVRQPIYSTSIGRWKKWQPFIQPLLDEIFDLEVAYWAEVGVVVNH